MDKYRVKGVEEMSDPGTIGLSPLQEKGQAVGVIWHFGGEDRLHETIQEMQPRLSAI